MIIKAEITVNTDGADGNEYDYHNVEITNLQALVDNLREEHPDMTSVVLTFTTPKD